MPYSYRPLVEPSSDIRLVVLQPGLLCDPICLILEHYSLSGDLIFAALSYTWGDAANSAPILIDGIEVHVTVNLECALRHLRLQNEPLSLWIDAICINQSDVSERNRQVGRMSRIYRAASIVIAWLGPAADDSDLAVQVISGHSGKELFPDRTSNESLQPKKPDIYTCIKTYAALVRLYSRSWWRRAWIIQEVVNSRELLLVCGYSSVAWHLTERFVKQTSNETSEVQRLRRYDEKQDENSALHCSWLLKLQEVQAPARILCAEKQFLNGHNLTTKLWMLRDFEASDPRDIAWIALSLTSRSPRSPIVSPNYNLSLLQTYVLIFIRHVNTGGSLDILEEARGLQETSLTRLPSWIPDWRGRSSYKSLLQGTDHSHMGQHLEYYISQDNKLLRVVGIELDEVTLVRNHAKLEDGTPDRAKVVDQFLQLPDGFDATREDGRQLREVMMRVMLAGHADLDIYLSNLNCLKPAIEQGILAWKTPFYEQFTPMAHRLHQYLNEALVGRRFFGASKRQLVGLAPEAAKVGDRICTLFGAAMPFVLRPVGDGTYILVGACYVYGMMQGKALSQTGVTEKTFTLV